MTRDAPTTTARDRFGLAGTELESRYAIERVVAEGGFGVVYAGYDRRLNVPVAVKVLKPDDTLNETLRREFAERFVREAQTVARLRHPNIVAVQNVGVTQTPAGASVPWMVMEWLDGHTLQHELQARAGGRRMAPRDALALLRPVIDSVAHAHEEGFAHRDLKPANVMLVPRRRAVVPYVLDFGVAKAFAPDDMPGSGATSSRDAAAGFTASYAAPEQIGGTRTGPWTDVHALGLMLVELLIGRRPYEGNDRTALFTRALAESRPTPARFGVDVGPLEPVLTRALALRPDARFASAREFLDALDAALDSPSTRDDESVGAPANAAPHKVSATLTEPSSGFLQTAPARAWSRRVGAFSVATLGLAALSLGVFYVGVRPSATSRDQDAAPRRVEVSPEPRSPPPVPTVATQGPVVSLGTSPQGALGREVTPDAGAAPGHKPRPASTRHPASSTAAHATTPIDAGVVSTAEVPPPPERTGAPSDAGRPRSSVDVTNAL